MTGNPCFEWHPSGEGFRCEEPAGHEGPHVCLAGLTWPDHDGGWTPPMELAEVL